MLFLLALLVRLFVRETAAYSEDALRDMITDLPGTEQLTFNFTQFSGCVTNPIKPDTI